MTGDVTISRRLVRLGYGGGIDIDTPKSRAGSRTVNLPPPTLERLKAWREQQEEQRKAAGDDWGEQGWVFTGRVGRHLEPAWVGHRFDRTVKQLGLERTTVHGLRHSFATILLANSYR